MQRAWGTANEILAQQQEFISKVQLKFSREVMLELIDQCFLTYIDSIQDYYQWRSMAIMYMLDKLYPIQIIWPKELGYDIY